MSKFAAMTANLLVRKGEAAPSTVTPFRDDRPMVTPAPKNHGCAGVPAAPRRIVLKLDARDYERLGLIAVKRGVSRQSLAPDAMTLYFEKLAGEFSCACIGGCLKTCAAE